ncbi:MAG: exonuclease domain-containing protein, partial [Betaproteobacteria bacterium]
MQYPRLAFVDVETTGLGAGLNRVAEIGVVTLDAGGVAEWESLLDPGRRAPAIEHEFGAEPAGFQANGNAVAPRFADISADLAARLDGRLLIAHNARFDYAFLKAEFERLAIPFAPPVLCTVMLSRKLYPQHGAHHLDALLERHGLHVAERHRALPDARVLLQFWQTIHREFPVRTIDTAISALLAEPLLPPHLDLALIDALPERSGIYTLVGHDEQILRIGRASNLRREVKRYFNLDRDCPRAVELSHRVRDIRCEVIVGPLEARLREITLRRELLPSGKPMTRGAANAAVSIRIEPSAFPAATLVSLADP